MIRRKRNKGEFVVIACVVKYYHMLNLSLVQMWWVNCLLTIKLGQRFTIQKGFFLMQIQILKTLMNSQSTSNWPVLCYVNKLTQHGLYLSLSIIAKSNVAFCAKHEMSANHERKGSWKMPCSPCLAIKCRLFRLPLIQHVVQHFLIVTSLPLCYSSSV